MTASCSGSCGTVRTGSAQADSIDLVSSGNDASEESEDIEEETDKPVATLAKNAVSSVLDKLKSPAPADINRLRKTKTYSVPPRGKRRCRGDLASDPKGVKPSQRVREFEKEPLIVSAGHLFCQACRE